MDPEDFCLKNLHLAQAPFKRTGQETRKEGGQEHEERNFALSAAKTRSLSFETPYPNHTSKPETLEGKKVSQKTTSRTKDWYIQKKTDLIRAQRYKEHSSEASYKKKSPSKKAQQQRK